MLDKPEIDRIIETVEREIGGSASKPALSALWLESEMARRDHRPFAKQPRDLAPLIDHTLLKPSAVETDITTLCAEADKYGFASVCVNPCWITHCVDILQSSPVMICTVVGFPLGANIPSTKAFEAEESVKAGADELDMVVNIGQLKAGEWLTVQSEIVSVVEIAGAIPVKVILETSVLSEAEIVAACTIARLAGAAFVKTSTGFSTGGASVEAVSLMASVVGNSLGIKASGGIGNFETAIAMIRAGASRIGSSRSVGIVGG